MKSKILAICCIFAWCILLAFGFQVSSSQARNQYPNSLAQFQLAQAQPIDVLNQQLNSIREKDSQAIQSLYESLLGIHEANELLAQAQGDLRELATTNPHLATEANSLLNILNNESDGLSLIVNYKQILRELDATTCPGSIIPKEITSKLAQEPTDVCGNPVQSEFDIFSWNSFIALNWPANSQNCDPDTGQSILSGKGPVVWETFSEDTYVFVDTGKEPAAWCSQSNKPKQFSQIAKTSPMVIQNLKSSELDSIANDIAEAVGGVLTDQNGRFVRYEKRLNLDEYQYIATNNLWNKQGQQGKTIEFPSGSINSGKTGAIEVKAAWKVLTQAEIAGKSFYTTTATVYNDAAGDPSPGPNPITLGLVGLHITHKTKSQPNWIWSTFEHVDNAPTINPGEKKKRHSFYNPACSGQYCEQNKQTAIKPYKELNPDGTPINHPVQVVRTTPIQVKSELNKHYQNLLKKSVWANYELVSTQWIERSSADTQSPFLANTTVEAFGVRPPFLANTTMETFIQKDAPLVTSGKPSQSSCIDCHFRASTASKLPADFSFLLQEAKPAK